MRDLLRPRLLVSHLLVLAVAATCVLLGQWQLDRLALVRDHNERLAERLEQPAVDVRSLVPDQAGLDVDAHEFRRARARGTFRPEEEVLQRNREHQGQSGFHVLTPLELADGGVVLVRRGWVPSTLSEPPVREAPPPAGEVVVTGVLERSVDQPSFGPRDPDEGVLARVFHADTSRLDRQVTGELFPMVLRATGEDVAVDQSLPRALGDPVLDERNHLSYAVQWHVFGLLALVSYGAWLVSRRRGRSTPAPRQPVAL